MDGSSSLLLPPRRLRMRSKGRACELVDSSSAMRSGSCLDGFIVRYRAEGCARGKDSSDLNCSCVLEGEQSGGTTKMSTNERYARRSCERYSTGASLESWTIRYPGHANRSLLLPHFPLRLIFRRCRLEVAPSPPRPSSRPTSATMVHSFLSR